MFSTDKNIETIAELIEAVRNYIGLQTKFVKLYVIEKIVRLLTALTMVAVLLLLLFIGLIYLSFAAAYALAPLMGMALAFACVAGGYFIMLILCVMFRKRWIERPLVKFLAGLLMNE